MTEATAARDVLRKSLRAIRRRELLSRVLSQASLHLLLALSACAAYLLAAWALGLERRPLWAFLAAIGAAALVTVGRAARSLRLSLLGTAVLADGRLGLKERVSSAVYLEERPQAAAGPGWVELVRRDGERALHDATRGGVDLRRSFPVRLPRLARWILLPVALGILFAWLEPLDLLGVRSRRQVEAVMQREVERKRTERREALEELRKAAKKPLDPEVQKALESLATRKLEGEPQVPKAEPPPKPGDEARREAMMEFARLEQVLERQLQGEQFQGLKAFLDRFPPGTQSGSPLGKALREALKTGSFGKAGTELKKLGDELSSLAARQAAGKGLTPEEMERMRRLSEDLERLARDAKLLSGLSAALSRLGSGLQAGDLGGALAGLEGLQGDLQSMEDLLRQLQFLEKALELAQLSQEDLSKLHRCPNCGKVSQNPGGT